jgi:hypothetical protein
MIWVRCRAPVARQAHNLEVGGSIPPGAISFVVKRPPSGWPLVFPKPVTWFDFPEKSTCLGRAFLKGESLVAIFRKAHPIWIVFTGLFALCLFLTAELYKLPIVPANGLAKGLCVGVCLGIEIFGLIRVAKAKLRRAI